MNIFVLSRHVRTCAELHCDQHVVKMPLETAQLLSTTLALSDSATWAKLREQERAYLPTHQQHPCGLWARECINNYLWLCRLGVELCAEYAYRFAGGGTAQRSAPASKTHKCLAVIQALREHAPALPDKRVITPFALVMPEEYRIAGDPVNSYRNYYRGAKAEFARYTRRPRPEWLAGS